MLVDKIVILMSEMSRGPGYHIYHRTCLHLKKTKKVEQMDDFCIQNKKCPIEVLQNLKGPPIRRSTVFQILIELAITGQNL